MVRVMLFKLSKEEQQLNIAEWSSLAARRAHNPKVVGSNPASATKKSKSVILVIGLRSCFFV